MPRFPVLYTAIGISRKYYTHLQEILQLVNGVFNFFFTEFDVEIF